jgi:hypothetical protein
MSKMIRQEWGTCSYDIQCLQQMVWNDKIVFY